MTTKTVSKPGQATYEGMRDMARVYHVVGGPELPPPIPYERVLSAAQEMHQALREIVAEWSDPADPNSPRAYKGFMREHFPGIPETYGIKLARRLLERLED